MITKTKTFAELCENKPSKALQAMIDGLLEYDAKPGFEIDMTVFGKSIGDICYGCAATCSIQKLAGVSFTVGSIDDGLARARATTSEHGDLSLFEDAIDSARNGDLYPLFYYLHVEDAWRSDYDDLFCLGTSNWKEQIPQVEALIRELEGEGI